MLTQAELNAIKERAEKATPGPWSFDGDFTARINGMLEPVIYAGYGELFVRDEDIDFITSAHADITKLVAEIERLNAKLGECEPLLSAAHDVMDDVHLYDTELYEEITQYFYGGDDE
jgi:hypothetical protein